jgi:hypothetical protein
MPALDDITIPDGKRFVLGAFAMVLLAVTVAGRADRTDAGLPFDERRAPALAQRHRHRLLGPH